MSRVPIPVTDEWLEEQYATGDCVKPQDLVDGAFYFGHCRNASYAVYDASRDRFIYARYKFTLFLESIGTLESGKDHSYDVFYPIRAVCPVEEEPQELTELKKLLIKQGVADV